MQLILCPGLLCDDALWHHQIGELGKYSEISVIDFSTCESIGAMADMVLAGAEPQFALAGLSMGGYVAQEIMRRAPERVDRLALLDTSARRDTPEQSARRRDLIQLAGRGSFRGVTPKLLPMLVHSARLEDEELCSDIMAMAQRAGSDTFLRHQAAIMNRPDGRSALIEISVPTLVLCGRNDRSTPMEVHLEMADAISGADLVVLGNCGHLSTMERPEIVTEVLKNWLTA